MIEQDDPAAGPWGSRLRMIRFDAQRDFAALHQYLNVVTREIESTFDVVVEDVESRLDPENNDMGDVYWRAEQQFGANPLEVHAHTGLMLVSRGVALSEIILATIPEALFIDADPLVYNGDHSWSRKKAKLFYATCLARPVDISDGAMAPITQLRDLYAHGYGRPHRKEEAEKLAAALHPFLGPEEPTPQETALGFTDGPYAFGHYDRYDPEAGFKNDSFIPVVADLSPVATRRLLLLIEENLEAALLAASWGLKNPLNEETSKFIREWMKEETERQAVAAAKALQDAEKIRAREAKRADVAERRQRDREEGLARQAALRGARKDSLTDDCVEGPRRQHARSTW